jgi:cytidylate kinase
MSNLLRDIPVEKQISRSMQHWEARRAERQRGAADPHQQVHGRGGPYIAISREAGGGGIEVSQRLAEKLGWQLYDREIVEAIARRAHVREELVDRFDEQVRSELDTYVYNVLTGQLLNNTEYLRLLTNVLVSIGHYGNAIILGRGANFVLPPETGLRVRLVAPLDVRQQYVMRTRACGAKEAQDEITERDNERRRFLEHHFRCRLEDPCSYDVVINTGHVSPAVAADAIIHLAEAKLGRPLASRTTPPDVDRAG